MLVCAVDETVLTVPDAPVVAVRYTKQSGNHGGTGHPQVRLLARVIGAEVAVTTDQGREVGSYRLLTSLLDPAAHPAADLVRLYHERWEVETRYLELKSSMPGGRVPRAHRRGRGPGGVGAPRRMPAAARAGRGCRPREGAWTPTGAASPSRWRTHGTSSSEPRRPSPVRLVLESPLPKHRLRACHGWSGVQS
ncbi:MAG: hypothetical protein LBC97_09180 [Bifidobacteriaceae bacterium]|nr:hypothetical protein [Bifidobacteriaceae bacterium]